MNELKDRVIVIAGAAGGLGQIVTRILAENGAELVLLGRDADRLHQLAADIGLSDERFLARAVDLSSADQITQAAEMTVSKFHRVDVLLNFVGGWTGGQSVAEIQPDEITKMLDQHLWSTFHLAQAFVPHLIANRWGRVVVVSSPSATHPRAKGSAYAIGKAAQETLILTLADELSGTGVTANIIQVKTIDTGHQKQKEASAKNTSWTTPEEIATAILYLLSPDAGMLNGARLPLYGTT